MTARARRSRPVQGSRLSSDPYRLALAALTVLSISKLHGYFPILGALRPALLLVGFCAVYAFMNPKKLASGNMFRTWPAKVILALGVLACFSTLFGISMGNSGKFILDEYSKTLVGAILVITAVRAAPDLRHQVWAVVVGGGALAYMSIFVVGISKTTGGVSYDANDIGLIMVMTLPLALLVFQVSGPMGRLAAGSAMILIGATIAKTQSRGAFLGMLATGAGLLFLLPGVSVLKRVGFVAVAAIAMAVAAPQGYWASMQTILESPKTDYNYTDINGRRMLAKRGMGYMLSHPVFGIGINNFPRAEGMISDKAQFAARGTGIRWAAAHNSFVQAGAELGIPGLLLFTGMIVGGMLGLNRLHRRLPRAWLHGTRDDRFLYLATTYFPVSLLGFAITGFFVSFAWTDPFYILGALTAGLYVCVEARLNGNSPAPPPSPSPSRMATRGMTRPGPGVVLVPGPVPGQAGQG
jgi:O-antigen ligase